MIRLIALLIIFLTSLTAYAAEPLDPEQAYQLKARLVDEKTVEVRWEIRPEYYLYRHKIAFSATPATVKLGEAQLPKGKEKDDEFFGRVETYRDQLVVRIPILAGSSPFTLQAESQGCWDGGVCYPPMIQQAKLVLAAQSSPAVASTQPASHEKVGAGQTAELASQAAPPTTADAASPAGDESNQIAQLLKGAGFWLAIVTFLGFGLLLSFTPCVFPMIPILSGIIVNHGHAVTPLRAFTLSLAYVLGMAVTYAIVGVAAGFSGTLLSAALQNAWVLGSFALVFVVLSFSMFGFYELQLPAALQSKLSDTANRQGGSLLAIAVMGALSALIVGPCVAAPLAGALLYIAQTKDAMLGGVALFSMGLGMGAPLLLVGLFSRSLLPKTGAWMEAVKKFFGVVLLATALWLVSPVLPSWLVMLGWAGLLIVPAIYLHALDPLPPHAGGWARFWKGSGVAMLLVGAAMLAGLLGGSRDPLQPLVFLKGTSGTTVAMNANAVPTFEKVKTVAELDARIASATKPVMLDFYADWCVSCKEMEKFTFSDPQIAARMQQFTLLKADVTANNADDQALLKRFGLFGPPGIIFFNNGLEVDSLRVVGYQPPPRFMTSIKQLPI